MEAEEKRESATNEIEQIETKPKQKSSKKQKVVKFLKERGWRFLVTLCVFAGFVVGCYFIFKSLGLLDAEGLTTALEGYGIWIYVIYVALFVVQAICLNVLPGNTATFLVVGNLLFNDFWLTALLGIIGTQISSFIIFFLGRFGGRKLLGWLFGKDAVDKKLTSITDKGLKYMPITFMIPFFPNDAVCLVCGSSKMKFWQFLLMVIPLRSLEVMLLMLYPLLLPLLDVLTIPEIILFINVIVIDLFLLFLYYKTLIKIFKKNILGKKYELVKKDYMVEEEVQEENE